MARNIKGTLSQWRGDLYTRGRWLFLAEDRWKLTCSGRPLEANLQRETAARLFGVRTKVPLASAFGSQQRFAPTLRAGAFAENRQTKLELTTTNARRGALP